MFTTPIGCLVFIAASLKAIGSEITKREGRRLPSLVTGFTKRLFTLVRLWGVDSFLSTLQAKYPASGCGYCHDLPCTCGNTKAAPWEQRVGFSLDPDQAQWSLGNWQSHHLRVYGIKNSDLVPDRLLGWLNEEFLEAFIVIGYLEYAKAHGRQIESALEALAGELPDILMRTLAIANRHEGGFDVETLLLRRYQHGCALCQQRYCICPDSMGDFGLFEKEVLTGTRPTK